MTNCALRVAWVLAILVIQSDGQSPLGRFWDRVDQLEGESIREIEMVSSGLVAVGNYGLIRRSEDGDIWTREDSGISATLNGIAEGGALTVAVGDGGEIITQTAGENWVPRVSFANQDLNAVCFGDGIFLAVGDGGVVLTSGDGTEWTRWGTSMSVDLFSAIWREGRFYVAGAGKTIASAAIGESWRIELNDPNRNLVLDLIVRANGKLFAAGTDIFNGRHLLYSSEDGRTWTAISGMANHVEDLTFGAGRFVAVSHSGEVVTSEDGQVWKQIQTLEADNLRWIFWDGLEFSALTSSASKVTSPAGVRWTGGRALDREGTLSAGCWTGDQYVVVSTSGRVFTSADAVAWTREVVETNASLQDVAAGDGDIVAVGFESAIFHSEDGRTWEDVSPVGSFQFSAVEWGGGEFLAIGWDGIVFSSEDGRNWQMKSNGSLDAVGWDGSRFVAMSGPNFLASSDGRAWNPVALAQPQVSTNGGGAESAIALSSSPLGYFAIMTGGKIFSSEDGLEWTQATIAGAPRIFSNFRAIASLEGVAVAVTYGGDYYRSTDLKTWLETSGPSGWANIIDAGPDHFCVAAGDDIFQSDDGLTWTKVHSSNSAAYRELFWTGTEWIALGKTGFSSIFEEVVARSSDGLTWTSDFQDEWTGVVTAVGNGDLIVGLDENGRSHFFKDGVWSADGSRPVGTTVELLATPQGVRAFSQLGEVSERGAGGNWTIADRHLTQADLTNVVHGAGQWLVHSRGTSELPSDLMRSSDGSHWEIVDLGFVTTHAIHWSGTEFQVLAGGLRSSVDGITWSDSGQLRGGIQSDMRCLVEYGGRITTGGAATDGTDVVLWALDDGDLRSAHFQPQSTVLSFAAGPAGLLALGTTKPRISGDGVQWRLLNDSRSPFGNYRSIVESPYGFFAIGRDGLISGSEDGGAWQEISKVEMTLEDAAVGDGKIVAVGSGIIVSEDGEQWTPVAGDPLYESFKAIEWNGSVFVAVGARVTATSSDGVSWVVRENIESLHSLLWNGEEFLAAREKTLSDFAVMASTDGVDWGYRAKDADLVSMARSSDLVLVADGKGSVYYSTNGRDWKFSANFSSGRSTNAKLEFVNGGFFYHGGSRGSYYSTDGMVWRRLSREFRSVIWTGAEYLGFGSSSWAQASPDGINWQQKSRIHTGGFGDFEDAIWTGTEAIVVGSRTTGFRSLDGENWTSFDLGSVRDFTKVVVAGNQIVALNNENELGYSDSGPDLPPGIRARDLAYLDGKLIACGDQGLLAILKDSEWVIWDSGLDERLWQLSETEEGFAVIGRNWLMAEIEGIDLSNEWDLVSYLPSQIALMAVNEGEFIGIENSFLGGVQKIMTSKDGATWAERPGGVVENVASIFPVDDELLVFQASGKVSILPPGQAGQVYPTETDYPVFSAVRSGEQILAVGFGNTIIRSSANDVGGQGLGNWLFGFGLEGGHLAAALDPDSDGLTNLSEYLHDLSPVRSIASAGLGRLPQMVIQGEEFVLQFKMRSDPVDFDVQLLHSTDLEDWRAIAVKRSTAEWVVKTGQPWVVTEEDTGGGLTEVAVSMIQEAALIDGFFRIEAIHRP